MNVCRRGRAAARNRAHLLQRSVLMTDALGWASALILLATIVTQIVKQWRERTVQGVSSWLFVGQTAASLGFTLYSALVGNWVFTATNALLFVAAITGWVITRRFKREHKAAPEAVGAPSPPLG